MIKKVINVIIALIIFGSIWYKIYEDPNLIFKSEVQEELIEAWDNLDHQITNFTNTIPVEE